MAKKPYRRVCIAPLDWGLGHASRCIPIIRELYQRDCGVLCAASGPVARFLQREFPTLETVPVINYSIAYAANPLLLALRFPGMLLRVWYCSLKEHQQILRIARTHTIDRIISDNRFGCFVNGIRSAYLSHQFCVVMPRGFGYLERLLAIGLRHAAHRFDHLWVPDFPPPYSLTGALSRKFPLPEPHTDIGMLSRFTGISPAQNREYTRPIDILVMISGPEPQRTLLEKRVITQLRHSPLRATVLLGKPGISLGYSPRAGLEIYSHLSAEKTLAVISAANVVICRGGYTTIMELTALRKKAVLIPTPGQTEQEYLARYLAGKNYFLCRDQKTFTVEEAFQAAQNSSPAFPAELPGPALDQAIDRLLQ